MLNLIIGTTDYKQFVPHILIKGLTVHKTVLGLSNKSINELIMNL